MDCTVCGCTLLKRLEDPKGNLFWECPECGFVSRDRDQLLTSEQERDRYLLHNNTPDDSGYVRYLERFIQGMIIPHLDRESAVLDFGSGPVPVLSHMLRDAGFHVVSYDKYFAADESYTEHRYDGIILLEVLEHIIDPVALLQQLHRLLADGGCLIIRTQLVPGCFTGWWYKEDRTHVSFFSERAVSLLASRCGYELEVLEKNSDIILRKGLTKKSK